MPEMARPCSGALRVCIETQVLVPGKILQLTLIYCGDVWKHCIPL